VVSHDTTYQSQPRAIEADSLLFDTGCCDPLGQSIRNRIRLLVVCHFLVFSMYTSADVLVDQSMMLGQSAEASSQLLDSGNNNFTVHIETGFVRLNLADHIDLSAGSLFSSALCFNSDMDPGEYRVSAITSQVNNSDPMVFRSRTDKIPYEMYVGGQVLTEDSDLFASSAYRVEDLSCVTGSHVNLTVSVDGSFLPDLWHGGYTDTIWLRVHPE